MSEKNWKQGGAFNPLKERVERIKDLLEKAALVQADQAKKTIEHIYEVKRQADLARDMRSMKREDLKGKVISDVVDKEKSSSTST